MHAGQTKLKQENERWTPDGDDDESYFHPPPATQRMRGDSLKPALNVYIRQDQSSHPDGQHAIKKPASW